ncbi:ead/Ea22-like family protein [Salmonella enterica]|uniref:ead/Ea22-like family protein n=1 Tax=Salmonella enterica TaxID=28901 RepID=UPI003FA7F02B|nr:ead/Ea22-like family protein [Salmonella enterica]
MKEVKIYTIVSDQLSPPITGESFCTDMVRHSDYADLEEKCAALAAENAGLKKSEVEFNEYCRRECEDVGDTWVDDFTETPDTDAFLAEVRAQGVERYAAQLKSEAELADEAGWDGAAKFLISESGKVLAFAAQIRQEAAK